MSESESTDLLPRVLERIREPIDVSLPLVTGLIKYSALIVFFLFIVLPVIGGVLGTSLDPWLYLLQRLVSFFKTY